MNLLPVRAVSLASALPPDTLAALLRTVIGDDPAAPFRGTVAGDAFAISRMNEYRSTFMPRLRGRLDAAPGGGTAVRLRLRPPGTVVVFMAIWLAFLAAVAALIVAAHALGGDRGLAPLLAPAGLGAFSWHLMASVFASDARWAVARLCEAVPALVPAEIP